MRYGGVYAVLTSLFLSGAGYVFHASTQQKVDCVTLFELDSHISDAAQQEIMVWLEDKEFQRPYEFTASIKKEFPEIASVSISYSPLMYRYITLHAEKPLLRINGERVLCAQGPLVSASFYNQAVLREVPAIDAAGSIDATIAEVRNFAQQLPPVFFQRFQITWHSPTKILFQDKQETGLSLISNVDTIPVQKMLEQSDAIYAQIRDQKKNKKITMDLRFENQIISYFKSAEGGYAHG
jgi:hypothetical protein